MSLLDALATRSESICEICKSIEGLSAYTVSPRTGDSTDDQVVACKTCVEQIENSDLIDPNHWRALNESIWSQVPAVQVLSYRMLKRLQDQPWAQDLLSMMYMEDATREWAEYGQSETEIVHVDSNGNVLQNGDSVVLIKDLKVSGANFTAKRGTAVRRISLVHDNPHHIEGRVSDQHIVILTQFVKKT